MKEVWKEVEGYEGVYEVSNEGRVRNVKTGLVLKQRVNNRNYLTIGFFKDNKYSRFTVHRLVAKAFIPNPHDLPCVNHIDGNQENNWVDNLEWCTQSENVSHAYRTGARKRKLSQEDIEYIKTHFIKGDRKFGARPLGRKFGVDKEAIKRVLRSFK